MRKIAQPIIHKPLLEELKSTYGQRNSLPLWASDKLINICENASDETLRILEAANINFVSIAARLELLSRDDA